MSKTMTVSFFVDVDARHNLSHLNFYFAVEQTICADLLRRRHYTLLIEPCVGTMQLIACARLTGMKYLCYEISDAEPQGAMPDTSNRQILQKYCVSHAFLERRSTAQLFALFRANSSEVREALDKEKILVFFPANVLGMIPNGLDLAVMLLRNGIDVVISQFECTSRAIGVQQSIYAARHTALRTDIRPGEYTAFSAPDGFTSRCFDRSYLQRRLSREFQDMCQMSFLDETDLFSIAFLETPFRSADRRWRTHT